MKSPQRWVGSLLLAVVATVLMAGAAFAQTPITDDNGVRGFELYQNGLFWWSGGGVCDGEFPHDTTIRLRNTVGSSTKSLVNDCTVSKRVADNPVRDDAYLYFFQDGQLSRKALNAVESDTAQALANASPLPAGQFGSNLALAEGNLYWTVAGSGTTVNIVRMPVDGGQAPTTVIASPRPIIKLAWRRYTDTNSQSQLALVWITDDNRLFRYRIGAAGSAQQLATTVADFALHSHIVLNGSTTSIYAAIGTTSVAPASAPGKLLQINIDTAAQTTVYNATGHDQVLAVGTDGNTSVFSQVTRNVYIAIAGVSCGDLFCTTGDTSIWRHSLPANTTNWQLIVPSGVGGNLRSDNQWLYYVTNSKIDRIKTDAPALELDIKADGAEIVQVVQNLNQDVRLVTGKPTFARGYAHFAKNTTGKSNWLPAAELRGFLNGVPLPGSPLKPLNSVALGTNSDINFLRNDLSRSYLFQLPDSWVKNPGALTVEFVVDPLGTLPETASTVDNKIGLKKAATIVGRPDACLDFVRMHTATTIGTSPTGLTEIVARAASLLPVQEFQVRTSTTRISKPVFHVEIECWGPFCVPVPYVTDEPFDMSEDKDWAMALLTIWDTFNADFGSCSDSYLVGMVHPSESDFNGLGLTSFSHDVLVRMEPEGYPTNVRDTEIAEFNRPYGGRTLAHELSHNHGREHIDQTSSSLMCGGDQPKNPDTNYPYDTCTIGPDNSYNGFDVLNQTLLLPGNVGDLMTYATTRWTSNYTWDAFLNDTAAANETVQAATMQVPNAAMLLVTGLVTPTQNSARFETFYLLPEGTASQSALLQQFAATLQVAGAGADPYLIRQLDTNGATLSEVELVLPKTADDVGDAVPFAQYVAFDPQTVRVQLVQNNVVLAEKTASATAPTLTLQTPVVNEAAQTLSLAWMAYDNDNTLEGGFTDVLFFTVQYSPDNGTTWYNLLVQYPWLAATIDSNQLPGGTAALVRVLATDGFNTTVATSAPFALAKHAPTALIGGVKEGERFPYTTTVTLLGLGLDAEDGGVAADQLAWTVTGPTPATGSGTQLDLNGLTPGSYTATLTATDSDNQSGSAAIHFTVLPLAVADQSAPTLDGLCADSGYANAPLVTIPLADGNDARAWLLHADAKLYLCFADLQLAANNAPTMTVGIRIDVDNSGGAQLANGDLGFSVDQDGTPYQLVLVGNALQPTQSPQQGYSVVIERGASGWSAEMAIDESLLGGWEHAVRILLTHSGVNEFVAAGGSTNGLWPTSGDRAVPASWASLYLGTLPTQPNQAPVAVAGSDLNVNLAVTTTVGLDGSGSFDADGDELTYSWSQVAGPAVTLSANSSATPSFQVTPITSVTTLRFQLVVNDGAVNSTADEVVVTLLPTPRAHTPSTFTPSDAETGFAIYLPLVQR